MERFVQIVFLEKELQIIPQITHQYLIHKKIVRWEIDLFTKTFHHHFESLSVRNIFQLANSVYYTKVISTKNVKQINTVS